MEEEWEEDIGGGVGRFFPKELIGEGFLLLLEEWQEDIGAGVGEVKTRHIVGSNGVGRRYRRESGEKLKQGSGFNGVGRTY